MEVIHYSPFFVCGVPRLMCGEKPDVRFDEDEGVNRVFNATGDPERATCQECVDLYEEAASSLASGKIPSGGE